MSRRELGENKKGEPKGRVEEEVKERTWMKGLRWLSWVNVIKEEKVEKLEY